MDSANHPRVIDPLAGWRASLAQHESLTPERLRELETHLREDMARLTAVGLSESEALGVARQRLGEPVALAAEFHHAQPLSVWRGRVFWMAIGILLMKLLQPPAEGVGAGLVLLCRRLDLPAMQGLVAWLAPLLFIAGMVALLMGLADGRLPGLSRGLDWFCSRRRAVAWQLVVAAGIPTLLAFAAGLLFLAWTWDARPDFRFFMVNRLLFLLWPLALAVLAAHYAPKRWTATSADPAPAA